MAHPKKSKNRHNLLEILRNKGNHSHNLQVLREGKGLIIPYKRPTYETAVHKTIQDQVQESMAHITAGSVSREDFSKLGQAMLAQTVLFNRKRSGEVERMTVENYKKRTGEVNKDVLQGLNKLEKELCKKLSRVEIPGKRCAQSSGAEHPENITSTQLRKHVATMSQILCLKDNELDVFATFMGHNIQVHIREFYRLPENTLQVAKIAKILLLMEKGQMNECSGMSLDSINVNLNGEYKYS
ncbi:uncharacterized protein [Diadema antillarum]|uniref:uncharacterized protein n=1 Tax=Diadema antillarum TaxID=105358 RepID=UPI003A89369D